MRSGLGGELFRIRDFLKRFRLRSPSSHSSQRVQVFLASPGRGGRRSKMRRAGRVCQKSSDAAPHIKQNGISQSDCLEPVFINGHIFRQFNFDSQSKFLEFFCELFAIDYINCDRTVTCRLFQSIAREVTCSDEQTLISTSLHCSSKISNFPSADSATPTFALKDNSETEDSIDSRNSSSVNSTIAGSTRHFHLHKPRFSQNALD